VASRNGKQTAQEANGASGFNPAGAVVLEEKGISGTPIYGGRPQVEENPQLSYERAYGHPGQLTWGEYDRIIKTDPDAAAGLDLLSSQIRDARLDVEPADLADESLAQAQADYLFWNLTEAIEPGWATFITQVTRGSLVHGFSLHEVVFGRKKNELLPGGSGYGINKLPERLPSSIEINGWVEDEDTKDLSAIKQSGPGIGGKWVNVELPAQRIFLVTNNREGNNYLGTSILRPIAYLAKVRRELTKLVAISLSREGAGVPIASSMSGGNDAIELSEPQRNALMDLLSNIQYHESSSVVMPAGWKLDWIYSPGANKGHVLDAYSRMGEMILRQFGAQQLMLGTGSTGSRSVGEVHSTSLDTLVDAILSNLEAHLNGIGSRQYTGLGRKVIDANWGPQTAYPRIKLTRKKTKMNVEEKVRSLTMAIAAGVASVTLEDENSIREDLGLSPITEEQRSEYQARKSATRQVELPAQEEFKAPQTADAQKEPSSAEQSGLSAGGAAFKLSDGFTPRRALRASEKVLALAEMSSYLDKGRDVFQDGAKPLLIEMLKKAAPAIKKAMADGDFTPSELATIKLDTKKLKAFVGTYAEEVRAEGYKQARNEKAKGSEAIIEKRQEGEVAMASVSAEITKAKKLIDAQRDNLLRRLTARLIDDIEREAIETIRTGGTADDVLERVVARQLEDNGLKRDAGVILAKTFNTGREEFARERGEDVASVELSSILDGKQCSPCDELDGSEYEFNSAEHDAHVPPLTRICDGGDNCRCVLIYNWKGGQGFKPSEGGDEN